MAVVAIDTNKVVFKFLSQMSNTHVSVKVNCISWSYFKIFTQDDAKYLVVYGLTPLFQYEIELFDKNGLVKNSFLINTTNGNNEISSQSLNETSSLVTLQTSLETTMTKIDGAKSKLKKYKKEENKKISDLKNSIEVLKNKISKYNGIKPANENRVYGKIQGLKHSVIQLESEIETIKTEIETAQAEEKEIQKQFIAKQALQTKEIEQLENEYHEFETKIKEIKSQLSKSKQDSSQFSTKYQKILAKQSAKQDEVKLVQQELRNLKKNEILNKFSKRIKKTTEKFETIIPKIINETELLQNEARELLSSGSGERNLVNKHNHNNKSNNGINNDNNNISNNVDLVVDNNEREEANNDGYGHV